MGGDVIGGEVKVSSVGKGVRGGLVSSIGRVTVGVGACVVFFPASTAETRVVIIAMADWIFMMIVRFSIGETKDRICNDNDNYYSTIRRRSWFCVIFMMVHPFHTWLTMNIARSRRKANIISAPCF